MIELKSLSQEWIEEKRLQYRKDPILIESMLHALYLLEQLQIAGIDFVFKGGTCLLLLLENPRRFSVDIDIILPAGFKRDELESLLEKVVAQSKFVRVELDSRRSYQGEIPKAHYKFIYQSNNSTRNKEEKVVPKPEREILLDILFADDTYETVETRPIKTGWLLQTDEIREVRMPNANSIAGDKMTAFAPNTTGVPYKSDKEKEILKQVFDIGCLFGLIDNVKEFKNSYSRTVVAEIQYRPERKIESVEQVLWDTINTAVLFARRDQQESDDSREKFEEIRRGLDQFQHFVFEGNFRIEQAQVATAKAAYLAAIVLTDYEGDIAKFTPDISIESILISHPDYNFLNKKLKFVEKGEALFYWNKTIGLLFPVKS